VGAGAVPVRVTAKACDHARVRAGSAAVAVVVALASLRAVADEDDEAKKPTTPLTRVVTIVRAEDGKPFAGVDVEAAGYRQHPCKGDYFALAPGAPLRLAGLVYPVHGAAGLGVHVTLDLGGRVKFGPDATYVNALNYAVDPAKAADFAEAAGRYLPELRAEWLSPDQAGIRPKLQGPGAAFRDFVIAEESARGLPGLVNLVGIESPGLTAAPAIAERVVELLR